MDNERSRATEYCLQSVSGHKGKHHAGNEAECLLLAYSEEEDDRNDYQERLFTCKGQQVGYE